MGQQNISSCFFFFLKPNLWPKANQSSILHLSISYLNDFTNTLHGFAAGQFSFCFLFCFFKKEKKSLKISTGRNALSFTQIMHKKYSSICSGSKSNELDLLINFTKS